MTNEVLIERHDGLANGLATVCLNRPQSLNALNADMIHALADAMQQVAGDESVRVVVLRGREGHFMSGGDLGFFASLIDAKADPQTEQHNALIERVNDTVRTITEMPKPVIAVVEGAAAGIGMSLVLACDLALAADNSYFTTAYRSIGATPDGGLSFHLPRHVGLKQAMRLLLLGERFDARQAVQMGLVNEVVPLSDLDARLEQLVAALLTGPREALSQTKRLLRRSLQRNLDQQLQDEAACFIQSLQSPDFAEGVRAFLEKRPAKFGAKSDD